MPIAMRIEFSRLLSLATCTLPGMSKSAVIIDAPRDRARGALVGLAVGDAVGTSMEFAPPGSFTPLTTIADTSAGAMMVACLRTGTALILA